MRYDLASTLKECKDILKNAHIRNNVSDAEYMCAEVLGVGRGDLFAIKDISKEQYHLCIENAYRRAKHEPLDSIIGYTTFYNLIIPFDMDVLTPRQETEILVEKVVKDISSRESKPRVLDLCSGSGCIGLAIAKSTSAYVMLSDISGLAINISMKNAKLNNVDVDYVKSDIFSNITERYDIIVSNPPYIMSRELDTLEDEVKYFDPMIALDGKEDGYYFYREIIKDLKHHLTPHGKIYFEVGYNQAKEVAKMLEEDFEDIFIIEDYNGVERIVSATLKD